MTHSAPHSPLERVRSALVYLRLTILAVAVMTAFQLRRIGMWRLYLSLLNRLERLFDLYPDHYRRIFAVLTMTKVAANDEDGR